MKKVPVQNHRKIAIQRVFLQTLYIGGMLSIALLTPQMARILPHPDRSRARRKKLYARILNARSVLRQRGLVDEAEGRLRLTSKGRAHIERILMFDIYEKRRKVRAKLRALLTGVGFVRLQDSVWVYPYPCDEFVELVRAHIQSGVRELRLIVADALESDRPLREHFKLSLSH